MRPILRVSVLSLAVTSAAFAGRSGQASERRVVGEFDSIEVHSGIHLTVDIGERLVEVTTDDETMAKVVTEVNDGVLDVGFERKGVFSLFNHVHGGDVEVRVRTPRLRSVEASGGADAKVAGTTEASVRFGASGGGSVTVERAAAREVDLSASGGATLEIGGLEAAELRAHGSGGATLSLKGHAAEAKLSFSGGTEVKGAALEVQRLSVHGSGGGSARLQTVADSIQGSLSGGSTLHVGGSPRADVHTSGGGEVVYADGRRSSDRDEKGSWGSRRKYRDHDRKHDDEDDDD